MPSVLIVDDLLSIHEMLDAVIQPTGFSTAFATDGEKALARYKSERFDLVLADIDMKPMDGITLLKQLKAHDPNSVVVIMTAYASTESAIQALKYGAFDYLQKPFRVDELIATLRRGHEAKQYYSERPLAAEARGADPIDIESRLIGASAKNKKLIAQVKKLTTVRTPVLLQGEPGSGKTTVAELLHGAVFTASDPFVKIDCAMTPENGLREGLFGADGNGGKWIKEAKGGTLLLQHLDSLPLGVQKNLVGVLRNNAHGFRLICTTNTDLEKLTDEGRFNDELFYRVASLPALIPPLRSRTEDIPALAKHFTTSVSNSGIDSATIEFSGDALNVLKAYHWPGNIAELKQVVSKLAATTTEPVIAANQFPLKLKEPRLWPSLKEYLQSQEASYREMVLKACGGDEAVAAKILQH